MTASGGRLRERLLAQRSTEARVRTGTRENVGHRKSASKRSLRESVQIRPPQPTLRTDLDIGAEKSETIAVSDFFYAFFAIEIYRYPKPKTAFREELNSILN